MAKKKRSLVKRPTRGELFSALRNLYGDLTTDRNPDDERDGGAVIRRGLDLGMNSGVPVDNVLILDRKLRQHLRAISKLMDREDEARGAF